MTAAIAALAVPIIVAIIAAIPGILAWRSAALAAKKSASNEGKLDGLHIAVNSRLDALIKLVKAQAFSRGYKAGKRRGGGER